jgi:2-hydroxychromene-2-carboxylate isomerase
VPPISTTNKAAWLARDLVDWTRHLGLPEFRMPSNFPINSLKANRLGLVAAEQGRIAEFSRATFRAAFAEGQDLADPTVLAAVARASGLEPEPALARAELQEIKDALRRNTDEALARGAFGAPTFFVGDTLFFGNDRLMFVEKALNAA